MLSASDAIAADIHDIVGIAMGNSTVVDRFTGTSPLSAEHAAQIGTLGYVARASGHTVDARHDHPFADLYADLPVPTYPTGDVLARFQVRVDEIDASTALLRDLLRRARPGTHRRPLAEPARTTASGVGLVEGWRGTIAHRVEVGPRATLSRVKIVDPSFLNWPALPVALRDTIVPDFPLTNKSFNLSYAGNDL